MNSSIFIYLARQRLFLVFFLKILPGKFARPFTIDSLAHARCLTAVLDLHLYKLDDLPTELQRNHYWARSCLFQNVKTVPLIVKFSHVNSVQCEVRVSSIILHINQFIHNNDITCRKQSTVPLRNILTVHTHRRRSVEWVGKASLKIFKFYPLIPNHSFF